MSWTLGEMSENEELSYSTAYRVFNVGALISWLFQVYVQISQMVGTRENKLSWLNKWNLVDYIHLLGVLELLLYSQFFVDDIPFGIQCNLMSVTSISLVLKAYDWLRIFETTGFYIYLIE